MLPLLPQKSPDIFIEDGKKRLLVTGQSEHDSSLIDPSSGEFFSFATPSISKGLENISKDFDEVIYRPHPFDDNKKFKNQVLEIVGESKFVQSKNNTYWLMHYVADYLFTISSSTGYEADYFRPKTTKSKLTGSFVHYRRFFGNEIISSDGLPFRELFSLPRM
jgi:hypothetical protein